MSDFNALLAVGVVRFLPGVAERQAEKEARDTASTRRYQRWGSTPTQPSIVSLDAPLGGPSPSERYEVLADPASDPAVLVEQNERSERLRELVGDMEIEDVSRLTEWHLSRLRERLIEEGIAPRGVQAQERERLREPAPHRGEGSAPIGHAKMRGRAKRRTAKERSARHKQVDKRYNRRKEKYRVKDAA